MRITGAAVGIAVSIIAIGTTGCATTKYVRNETSNVATKMDEQVTGLAMDEHAADANVPWGFELDARRELVGVRLLQVGIDTCERATKGEQLRALLARLEDAVAVGVHPRVAGPAEIVLVGR